VAVWLLQSIGMETSERLAEKTEELLCSACVVHCHPLEISLPEQGQLTYYGCRRCRQSLDFQSWPAGVVAVLDQAGRKKKIQANGQIRVNWLADQDLFDFDRVEIIRASDEAVERFAVQVGNDTDEARNFRYKKMRCTVSSNCRLSANTLRVLEHTFGDVQTTG
jgi:hypothetical protein